MIIANKQMFYDLAERGLVGNTPKTWDNVRDWILSDEFRTVEIFGLRSKLISNPLCFPNIHRDNIVNALNKNGIAEGSYVITMIPTRQTENHHCLQGELTYSGGDFYLFFTTKWGYMRKKLSEHGRHAFGVQVPKLLSRFCDLGSEKMLYDLLGMDESTNRFPTIEFTVFPRSIPFIGRFPNLNTLVWEVRHY